MIKIIADLAGVREMLRGIDGRLSDLRTPNRRAGKEMLQLVHETFDAEKAPWGAKWRPLRRATLEWRKRKGYRRAPKLNASGWLRASIGTTSGRTGFDIHAAAGYSEYQQFGNPENEAWGKKLAPIPARPFLPIRRSGKVDMPDAWWDRVMQHYTEYLA